MCWKIPLEFLHLRIRWHDYYRKQLRFHLVESYRDGWGIRMSGVIIGKFVISDRLKFGRRFNVFIKLSLRMPLLGWNRKTEKCITLHLQPLYRLDNFLYHLPDTVSYLLHELITRYIPLIVVAGSLPSQFCFALCQIFNFAKSVIQMHLNLIFRIDKDLAGVNSTSRNDECVNKLKFPDYPTSWLFWRI